MTSSLGSTAVAQGGRLAQVARIVGSAQEYGLLDVRCRVVAESEMRRGAITMATRHEIPMLMLHERSPRFQEAPRDRLTAALPDAQISEPDDRGVFEVAVEADDLDQALQQVWDAVAASGTDDHIVFLEHPDLPEHWRLRSGRPGGFGSLA